MPPRPVYIINICHDLVSPCLEPPSRHERRYRKGLCTKDFSARTELREGFDFGVNGFSSEDFWRHVDPEPDAERFVASIYADRRRPLGTRRQKRYIDVLRGSRLILFFTSIAEALA